MVAVYIDPTGDVRSANTDMLIAPAGTSPRQARIWAALWAATADALHTATTAGSNMPATRSAGAEEMPAVVAPISAAPSYARTVGQTRDTLTVISGTRLSAEILAELNAAEEDQSCR